MNASPKRVIFRATAQNHPKVSASARLRNKAQLLSPLHGLRSALRAQLSEHAVRVRFHGILAHKHACGDFPIAQTVGDQCQDLQFPRRQPQRRNLSLISLEGLRGGHQNLPDYDLRHRNSGAPAREEVSKPQSQRRKHGGYQRAVDLDGMLNDNPAILNELQRSDEQTAQQSVREYVFSHPTFCEGHAPSAMCEAVTRRPIVILRRLPEPSLAAPPMQPKLDARLLGASLIELAKWWVNNPERESPESLDHQFHELARRL